MERKTITNAVNSEQSLSKLNPEAAEYQPQECVFYDPLQEAVRALIRLYHDAVHVYKSVL